MSTHMHNLAHTHKWHFPSSHPLCKILSFNDTCQEIYRIKLPGVVQLGEGKPENQNHAIIFTRGEALQAIDMNQVKFTSLYS